MNPSINQPINQSMKSIQNVKIKTMPTLTEYAMPKVLPTYPFVHHPSLDVKQPCILAMCQNAQSNPKKVAHQNCNPQDAKSLILCNNAGFNLSWVDSCVASSLLHLVISSTS